MRVTTCILLVLCCLFSLAHAGEYMIGSGIGDVTGEITEGGFMGYAVVGQTGSGVHTRLRARAFAVANADGSNPVVYVSIDLCMGFEMVKLNVIDKLKAKYNGLYTHDNVIISGTHTHSTPGGVGGTILVDLTTFGYIPQNHRAAVTGIVKAIVDAHESRALGDIYVKTGILDGANINRSPSAYLNDPIKERADYKHDTDHLDTIVRFDLDDGTEIGVIDFFAVHGVSMNNTNTLVSGDNKGVASALFEKAKNPKGTLIGEGNFVAAFGQTNEGDVSPNTAGPSCPDGSPCDGVHSTCGGYAQGCTAKGPGKDMFESTLIIGKMQFDSAYDLYHAVTAEDKLKGPVDYRHTFTEMQNLTVDPAFTATGEQGETCEAGLGFSFAGGTTDGPGEFDFTQGVNSTKSANKLWAFAASFLAKPTKQQVKCQAPKPILLDVAHPYPFAWVPTILPNQIVRIGNLYILAVPGEFTTMSGRRLRNAVELVLRNRGQWEEGRTRLVIAGLANSYSHYTATWEEFQVQRYEGASTLYGPHSSAAYRQIFTGLINSMLDGTTLPAGPTPLDMRKKVLSFHTPVVVDGHPWGIPFGSVRTDVDTKKTYTAGDTVKATFWCASPRNNVLLEGSFMAVDKKTASAVAAASSGRGHLLEGRRTLYLTDDDGDGDYDATHVLYDGGRRPSLEAVDAGTRTGPAARVVGDIMEAAEEEGKNYYEDAPDSRWDTVATDSDWSTKFRWKRKSISESLCSTEWTIPADATSGTYRFRTMGVYKSLTQKKYSYSGHSSEFKVQV